MALIRKRIPQVQRHWSRISAMPENAAPASSPTAEMLAGTQNNGVVDKIAVLSPKGIPSPRDHVWSGIAGLGDCRTILLNAHLTRALAASQPSAPMLQEYRLMMLPCAFKIKVFLISAQDAEQRQSRDELD